MIKRKASDLEDDETFPLAVKPINQSATSDGLYSTSVVYGASTRIIISTDSSSPWRIPCMSALKKMTTEMAKTFLLVTDFGAISTRNVPGTTDNEIALINSSVLAYCLELDKWDFDFQFQWTDGEKCYILLPPQSGPKIFCSNVVQSYTRHYTPNSTTPSTSASDQANGPTTSSKRARCPCFISLQITKILQLH